MSETGGWFPKIITLKKKWPWLKKGLFVPMDPPKMQVNHFERYQFGCFTTYFSELGTVWNGWFSCCSFNGWCLEKEVVHFNWSALKLPGWVDPNFSARKRRLWPFGNQSWLAEKNIFSSMVFKALSFHVSAFSQPAKFDYLRVGPLDFATYPVTSTAWEWFFSAADWCKVASSTYAQRVCHAAMISMELTIFLWCNSIW